MARRFRGFFPTLCHLLATNIGSAWSMSPPNSRIDHLGNAEAALDVLQDTWFNSTTGLWHNDWWTSANQLTTVANLGQISTSERQRIEEIIEVVFDRAPKSGIAGSTGWLNGFYDDEGWWALAWIAAYDLTENVSYLDIARDIFWDLVHGWETDVRQNPCGGIWWNKDKTELEAIANSLMFSAAAHLSNRLPEEPKWSRYYREWALLLERWFRDVGLVNAHDLVNDGLQLFSADGTPLCANNGDTTWTYNQGVLIGALAELNRIELDEASLELAHQVANATILKLTDADGVLTEQRDTLDATAAQFKGVFNRNLAQLQAVSPREEYAYFLEKNSEAIWSRNRDGRTGQLGPRWQGPYQEAVASAHGSAMDGIVAAAMAVADSDGKVMPSQVQR